MLAKYENIEKKIHKRKELGYDIQVKCWDVSAHVLHYREHTEEYEQELDTFLKDLKLKNCYINE